MSHQQIEVVSIPTTPNARGQFTRPPDIRPGEFHTAVTAAGWLPIPVWGAGGWGLGSWPHTVVYLRQAVEVIHHGVFVDADGLVSIDWYPSLEDAVHRIDQVAAEWWSSPSQHTPPPGLPATALTGPWGPRRAAEVPE
ncbi:MAG: hypothetical protein AAGA90_23720 [Actinomycetota bacterium]